jgi:hypothetical protein
VADIIVEGTVSDPVIPDQLALARTQGVKPGAKKRRNVSGPVFQGIHAWLLAYGGRFLFKIMALFVNFPEQGCGVDNNRDLAY